MHVMADVILPVLQPTLMKESFRISSQLALLKSHTQLMSSLHSLIHYLYLTRVIHLDPYNTVQATAFHGVPGTIY